jgi:hypothetical protein
LGAGHTHRPALKSLIESLALNITATNEPKRIKCGAPDFISTTLDTISSSILHNHALSILCFQPFAFHANGWCDGERDEGVTVVRFLVM